MGKLHGFWILREKKTSWACLLGSGLKLIFHRNAQLLILLKSLFKWLAVVLIFCTLEKRHVSSAKNLVVIDRFSDGSLMKTKNNSGESMEPWGTPSSMLSQGDFPILISTIYLKILLLNWKYQLSGKYFKAFFRDLLVNDIALAFCLLLQWASYQFTAMNSLQPILKQNLCAR